MNARLLTPLQFEVLGLFFLYTQAHLLRKLYLHENRLRMRSESSELMNAACGHERGQQEAESHKSLEVML